MIINAQFDAGNIECLDASDPSAVQLRIRNDAGDEHKQWFYFQVNGARDVAACFQLVNAGEVSYPDGFVNYQAVASYDRQQWFRVPTEFDGHTLSIRHTPETDTVYYAYFAPYSWERHQQLLAAVQEDERVRGETLCITPDGHPLTLLTIGQPSADKKRMWVIGRQHPGETMAQWWMEGFLERLLDDNDSLSRAILDHCVFYVVPNMNPDGSVRGHLRCNAKGKNLNRAWQHPTQEQTPEVYYVREAMEHKGIDFCIDVHGDEALPYNFIAGAEGIPSWNEHKALQLDTYKTVLSTVCPDFQTEHGYPVAAPGTANMTMSTAFIAEHFNCLAMTLEMPFKDTTERPMSETGWSPERSMRLGAANLDAMWQTLPLL
ncbi:MAG: M14 family metallopeptidase [Saccharospirillum sp.]